MKKKFLLIPVLFLTLSFFCSCVKNDNKFGCVPNNTNVPTSAEISALQAYLTSKSITASQDTRGFFYVINNPGTGATPALNNRIVISYTGTLENGTVFDSTPSGTTREFPLSGLILGWQYGVPLIKKGGSITLYLPPTLAYGCNSPSPAIPPGSNLIFTINLVDVL
jgi:FKBP-type peptidyl-prolyl cis-trans isomerase FkpA